MIHSQKSSKEKKISSTKTCSCASQVFDYDFGLQDDFIGSAFLDLNSLELNRYDANKPMEYF